ncbi:hypothetical protein D3C87_1353960 [compost metagenome]
MYSVPGSIILVPNLEFCSLLKSLRLAPKIPEKVKSFANLMPLKVAIKSVFISETLMLFKPKYPSSLPGHVLPAAIKSLAPKA